MADIDLTNGDGQQPGQMGQAVVPFGGYGPSAPPRTALEVVAPLNVRAKPGQMSYLAQQMLQFSDQMRRPMMFAADAEGRNRADAGNAAATIAGAKVDAQGNVDTSQMSPEDQQRFQSDSLFRIGAVRASAQNSLKAWITGTEQALADPNNPMSQMDSQSLAVALDQSARQSLGGLESDPITARAIAPMYSAFLQHTVSQRVQRQVEQTQTTALDNQLTIATAQLSTADSAAGGKGQGVVPQAQLGAAWANARKDMTRLTFGDSQRATEMLVNAFIDKARSSLDARYLDVIPQAQLDDNGQPLLDSNGQPIAGPAVAPQTAIRIREAQQYIAQEGGKQNEQAFDAKLTGLAQDYLSSGRDITGDVTRTLSMPGASWTKAAQLLNFIKDRSKEGASADSPEAQQATWGMYTALAHGQINGQSDLLTFINQHHLSTEAANALFTKGTTELAKGRSDEMSDPDYRAGLSQIVAQYAPVPGSPLREFQGNAAAAQSALAQSDYRSVYLAQRAEGQSTQEAARAALEAAKGHAGNPVMSMTGANQANAARFNQIPETLSGQAADVRSAITQHGQLPAWLKNATQLKQLADLGLLSDAEANQAASLYLAARHH